MKRLRSHLLSAIYAVHFSIVNLLSRKSITEAGGQATVSLTSYGARTRIVHLAIESIARGRNRPRRVVLWLDKDTEDAPLPRSLKRLLGRGLEILWTEDLGPHKKYFPYVMSNPKPATLLVTADDDTYYPRDWLRTLEQANGKFPRDVIAHRSRRIRMKDGRLQPYQQWDGGKPYSRSLLNLAVGVGGVLYPIEMQDAMRSAGKGFRQLAPMADDLWLHVIAIRNGSKILGINSVPHWRYANVRGLRRLPTLETRNVAGGGNDRQAENLYLAPDLELLARVSKSEHQNSE